MHESALGLSGWRINSIGLGTLGWGRDVDLDDADAMLRSFAAAGGRLLEIAPHYGEGKGIATLAQLLSGTGFEPQLVARIGLHHRGDSAPILDCSRGALVRALEKTCETLEVARVDLAILAHYDPQTPLEEMATTLVHLLDRGLCNYVGISNCPAWVFTRLHALVQQRRPGCFSAYEGEYSLLQRGVEREVLPATYQLGCGFIATSSLAGGVLTGKYLGTIPADSRAATEHLAQIPSRYLSGESQGVLNAVIAAADGLGWSPLEVSLAWMQAAPGVSCTLIGPRTPAQLDAYLEAAKLTIPTRIREVLSEVSQPRFSYPDQAAPRVIA